MASTYCVHSFSNCVSGRDLQMLWANDSQIYYKSAMPGNKMLQDPIKRLENYIPTQ